MNIKEVPLMRLKEYENNPRNNDLAVEKVKYSIQHFGFLFPVIIDMNYVIVAGHTRVRACRELGVQTVPCIIADELTEEQINLFRLVDNKSAEYSDWDFEKLKSELAQIDLTIEANQLLLDRFELTAEVFDLEPELAEIKIPSLNFMGEEDVAARKAKQPVQTVRESVAETEVATNDDADTAVSSVVSDTIAHAASPASNDTPQFSTATEPVTTAITDAATPATAPAASANSVTTAAVSSAVANSAPDTPKTKAPVLIQFRFGEVQFFISQIELNRLNAKYAEYIDSGAMAECSFANYLLKGVEAV